MPTDARGKFRFVYISPGTYSVTLFLSGFATVDYEQVVVGVNRSTQLRVTMKVVAVSETVTVTGATPAIDARKTVTGATFGKNELQEIPTARNIWATLGAVPGVVDDQVNVGGNTAVQAAPISKGTTGTSYNLDGANITLSGLSPTFYNFDSFQAIQVITGGSDASQLGGSVTFNLVTRRGTNVIHGSGRYFYAPNRWQAENTPSEVNLEDVSTNRTKVLRDYGVEAGGAILSDRLWIWGGWGTNQIDVQQVGQLDTEGRPVSDNSTLENFDARLDALLSASNSLELSYHHGDRTQFGRGLSITTAPESAFDLTQPVPIYKVADTQVFSPSLTASAFFSYMDFTQTTTPVGGVDTPQYVDPDGVLRGSGSFVGAPLDRSPDRGLGLEVLRHGKPFARAQVRVRIPVRPTTASSSLPGRQVYGDEASGSPTSPVPSVAAPRTSGSEAS